MGRKSITMEQKIAIKTLLLEHFSHTEISSSLGVSRKCVYNIAKKVSAGEPLSNKPGQGRSKRTTPVQDRYLVQICKRNRSAGSREIASEWSSTLGKSISASTTRRRLVEHGLKSYTKKRRPYRNKLQTKKRFEWCKNYVNWTERDWNRVVFSDESHFELINRKNRSFVRRTMQEKEQPFCFQSRTQGGGGSVSVWGCFTAHGTGLLLFYEGRLNARNFIELISTELPTYYETVFGSGTQSYFQQDNAPCHKAKFSMDWFRDKNISLLDWPPTSPDINPIENMWAIIDRNIEKYKISTTDELKNAIKDIWSKFTVDECSKLVNSIPKRIKCVLKAKGGSISSY